MNYKRLGILLLGIVISVVSFFWQPTHAEACTRALWRSTGEDVGLNNTQPYAICGRNMDWGSDMEENLWVFPRGLQRKADPTIVKENGMEWESEYGSIVTSVYDQATSDGMNEAGLAVHALWLADTNYGERDDTRPGLDVNIALQYLLDKFATVSEVVDFFRNEDPQLVTTTVGGPDKKIECHLAVEDAKGESLIVEYIKEDGRPDIFYSGEEEEYQGEYDVLTNNPIFKKQLKIIKRYEGFGGGKSLPGTTDAADRFVRAASYLKSLPDPENQREAIAGVLSVMRNAAQPFRNPEEGKPYASATRWRTVSDLEQKLYMYESTLNPILVWIEAENIDFSEGQPIRIFDMAQLKKLPISKYKEAVGEISDQLEVVERDFFRN